MKKNISTPGTNKCLFGIAFVLLLLTVGHINLYAGDVIYKNVGSTLTFSDLGIDENSNNFYISGEKVDLPHKLTADYLGLNELTFESNGKYNEKKLIVTDALRPVDLNGWTILKAAGDTRISYVSSSEGDDARGVSYPASRMKVSSPEDNPQGPFYERITPIMKDYTSDAGEVSGSSQPGWRPDSHPWKAFNRISGSRTNSWIASSNSGWLQFRFNSPQIAAGYTLVAHRDLRHSMGGTPKDWTFKASHDGKNWVVLDRVSGESGWKRGGRRTFEFSNSIKYSYYRLKISNTQSGSSVFIGDFEILGKTDRLVPLKTPEMAHRQTRRSFPDWILLKRGDVWETKLQEGEYSKSITLSRSGRSLEESMLVSAYGSGARPRLNKIKIYNNSSNVIFSDIRADGFRASNSQTRNVLTENLYLSGSDSGGWSSSYEAEDCELRRSIITENYPLHTSGHCQGVSSNPSARGGLMFEENLLDMNGWHSDVSGSATKFNHNAYLRGVNNISLRNNIFTRPSSMHIKMTGTAEGGSKFLHYQGNFFYDGEIGFSIGGNEHEQNWRFQDVIIEDNVLSNLNMTRPTDRGLAWYIGLSDNKGTVVRRNILTHTKEPRYSNTYGVELENRGSMTDVEISDNIFYNINRKPIVSRGPASLIEAGYWSNINITANKIQSPDIDSNLVNHYGEFQPEINYTSNTYHSGSGSKWFAVDKDPRWPNKTFEEWVNISGESGAKAEKIDFADPTRDLASYHQYIGGEASAEAFIEEAKKQDRHNWRYEYTAMAVNEYIREGFTVLGDPHSIIISGPEKIEVPAKGEKKIQFTCLVKDKNNFNLPYANPSLKLTDIHKDVNIEDNILTINENTAGGKIKLEAGIEGFTEVKDELEVMLLESRRYKAMRRFITPSNRKIEFGPHAKEVLITDIKGREVASLSGDSLIFDPDSDGRGNPESGLYIYKVIAKDGSINYGTIAVIK